MKQSVKPRTVRIRRWILVALTVAVFGVFIAELMRIQIADADMYRRMLDGRYISTQSIKAVRGEIVDRNAIPLAVNRMGYDVILDKAFLPVPDQNNILLRLIQLFEDLDEDWTDNLPVTIHAPHSFESGYEAEITRLKQLLDMQEYATADEVMYWLVERYDLEEFEPMDARKIAGVRYEMEQRDFSLRTPYTFATDIDISSVVRIKEQSYELSGVNVVESAIRVNENGDVSPHIIGAVGPLYKEEYAQLKEDGLIFHEDADTFDSRGYTMDDMIGKGGIEKAMEEVLRGYNGMREIAVDSGGSVVSAVERIEAVPGNTVVLSIDATLQRVAQESLDSQIAYLQETGLPGKGKESDSGAVIMIQCKTGEILATATSPTFNLSTYRQDYAQLIQQDKQPLFDRSIMGEYRPGSIFKPVTALAGLKSGAINDQSTVYCGSVYTFYEGHRFTCLDAHGAIPLNHALSVSCNIFFYDTGRRAGIDMVDYTAKSLGLGEPTGIEIYEAAGRRSNPDTKQQEEGLEWYPGDTIQTSIGQLFSKFSPLQLANYAATIGNRGKRMKLTLVHEIRDYSMEHVTQTHMPTVAHDMSDYDPAFFEAVVRGMVTASRTGSARGTFMNYPIDVASKTGTPQTSADEVNSTFICFAPAEDPEVAIAVVIEKGWHGYTGAPVAKALLDAYFGINDVRAPVMSGPQRLKDQRTAEAQADKRELSSAEPEANPPPGQDDAYTSVLQ